MENGSCFPVTDVGDGRVVGAAKSKANIPGNVADGSQKSRVSLREGPRALMPASPLSVGVFETCLKKTPVDQRQSPARRKHVPAWANQVRLKSWRSALGPLWLFISPQPLPPQKNTVMRLAGGIHSIVPERVVSKKERSDFLLLKLIVKPKGRRAILSARFASGPMERSGAMAGGGRGALKTTVPGVNGDLSICLSAVQLGSALPTRDCGSAANRVPLEVKRRPAKASQRRRCGEGVMSKRAVWVLVFRERGRTAFGPAFVIGQGRAEFEREVLPEPF